MNKYVIIGGILLLGVTVISSLQSGSLGAATVCFPPAGCTGIGSASQTGKTLVVTSTSPFRYSLENAGGTVGPGTSTQIAVFSTQGVLTSFQGFTYNSTSQFMSIPQGVTTNTFSAPTGFDMTVSAGAGAVAGIGHDIILQAGNAQSGKGGSILIQPGIDDGGGPGLVNIRGVLINPYTGGSGFTFSFPNKSGVFALTSDLPATILTGTSPSIGGGILTAGSCTSATTTVAGATSTMVVSVTPVTYPGDGTVWMGYVSLTNEVTTKVCTVATLTPAASVYRLRVLP
jgi:hypothetical protein